MGDGPVLAELEEKEDGELDSDQEEHNSDKASSSPSFHEDAIDKLLASCQEIIIEPVERISQNSLVSDRVSRKEKGPKIPITYRKSSNDGKDDRSSKAEKSIPLRSTHRSSSSSQQKSRRRKQKQRSRNESREKITSKSTEGKSNIVPGDVVVMDNEIIEKKRIEMETAKEEESQKAVLSKEKESSELEKRREKLDENARILEEKKVRLAKSERGVMMKKGYISDMCKRRDDYVARVKRLISDIENQIKEEGEMNRDMEVLRKEIHEDEVNWQKESNQLASDRVAALLGVNEQREDVTMEEVEEIINYRKGDEVGITYTEKEPEVINNTSMDDHDEETLRNLLLMQLQSKERSDEPDDHSNETIEGKRHGDPINGEEEEMEKEEVEMNRGERSMVEEGDLGSTMCPWDLNGICKDDECPYLHNRSSSRMDYSQEIST